MSAPYFFDVIGYPRGRFSWSIRYVYGPVPLSPLAAEIMRAVEAGSVKR